MFRRSYLRLLAVSISLAACAQELKPVAGPSPETVLAFQAHIRNTESRLDSLLQDEDAFLGANTPKLRARLQAGEVICEPRIGKGDRQVTRGLIHHWVGSVFIPGASVGHVLELIQDYDNHKNTYRPNVIDSRTLARNGNDFKMRLRLLERKLSVTVVLDTDYDIHYRPLRGRDWRSLSYSTRIAEIAHPGRPNERAKRPGEDRGYLWRLNSYWLFRERDGGTYVECETVSLSRSVPVAARMMSSFIRGLPRGFLTSTLTSTRNLVLAHPPKPGH